jgi:hypothetical protein
MQRIKSMSEPFWFCLIRKWCINKDGLSLPFIVGAQARYKKIDARSIDASDLIREIFAKSRSGYILSLTLCPTLKVPVIGAQAYFTDIHIDLDKSWGVNDGEKLAEVARRAQEMVDSGRFSRVGTYPNQTWGDFQEHEFEFIDSVIAEMTDT